MKHVPIKKASLVSALATTLLLGAIVLHAEQLTGWVTDMPCAKVGHFTGADHKKHVEEGKPAVFVNEHDKKIHVIANQDKVMNMIGEKVLLTGTIKKDDAIEVESVAVARAAGN